MKRFLIGLWLLVLVSCNPVSQEFNETATPFRFVPSSTPNPTYTSSPTLSPTPSPTPTPITIKSPFPTIAIHLANDEGLFSGFECGLYPYEGQEDFIAGIVDFFTSGEIWVSEYPYDDAMLLAKGNEKMGYMQPVWSPDGEWIAYIQVDKREFEFEGQSKIYPEGYSVWISKPDGTFSKKISYYLTLIDDISLSRWATGCFPVSKFSILGWSADSRYLAYKWQPVYYSFTKEQHFGIIDIETSNVLELPANDFSLFAWGKERADFVYYKTIQFETGTIENSVIKSGGTIPKPNSLDDAGFWRVFWGKDLYLIVLDFPSKDSVEYHLWVWDSKTKTWSKEIESLRDFVSSNSEYIISCKYYFLQDERLIYDFYNLINNQKVGYFSGSSDVSCDSFNWLTDNSENLLVSYIMPESNLYISGLYGFPPPYQTIQITIPDQSDLSLIAISWKPK